MTKERRPIQVHLSTIAFFVERPWILPHTVRGCSTEKPHLASACEQPGVPRSWSPPDISHSLTCQNSAGCAPPATPATQRSHTRSGLSKRHLLGGLTQKKAQLRPNPHRLFSQLSAKQYSPEQRMKNYVKGRPASTRPLHSLRDEVSSYQSISSALCTEKDEHFAKPTFLRALLAKKREKKSANTGWAHGCFCKEAEIGPLGTFIGDIELLRGLRFPELLQIFEKKSLM